MTRVKTVYVCGVDAASVSSGVNFVRGVWDGRCLSIESVQERAYKVPNTFLGHYECSKSMLQDAIDFREKHSLDLCSIEDATLQSFSYVSFSLGEILGLIRGFHYDAGFPLLFTRPSVMRSFAADSRKLPKGAPGKRALMQCALEDFEYTSCCRYAKERSDVSDAFLHAVIGVHTLMFLDGVPLDIISPKRRDIWRNKKGTGLLDNLTERLISPEEK